MAIFRKSLQPASDDGKEPVPYSTIPAKIGQTIMFAFLAWNSRIDSDRTIVVSTIRAKEKHQGRLLFDWKERDCPLCKSPVGKIAQVWCSSLGVTESWEVDVNEVITKVLITLSQT